jgi:hypothetical protein
MRNHARAALAAWHARAVRAHRLRAAAATVARAHQWRLTHTGWTMWTAVQQLARRKCQLAASRWFRVSATSALYQWQGFATDSLRLRSWEAFVVERWRRRALALALSAWCSLVHTLAAARNSVHAEVARQAAATVSACFRAWLQKAAHIAASCRLVRVACQGWNAERLVMAFQEMAQAASRRRQMLAAVAAVADARRTALALDRWRRRVRAERQTRTLDAWRQWARTERDAAAKCAAGKLAHRAWASWREAAAQAQRRAVTAMATATRRKRALVAGAWRAATKWAVQRRVEAVRAAAPLARRVQLRRYVVSWRSSAAAAAALWRATAVVAASRRVAHTFYRWRLHTARTVHAALMLRRATTHRGNLLLTRACQHWTSWAARAAAETSLRRGALGRMATRRAALALAAWSELAIELRPLWRCSHRFGGGGLSSSGGGFPLVSGRHVTQKQPIRGTIGREAKVTISASATSWSQTSSAFAASAAGDRAASHVGPGVRAAARARVKQFVDGGWYRRVDYGIEATLAKCHSSIGLSRQAVTLRYGKIWEMVLLR